MDPCSICTRRTADVRPRGGPVAALFCNLCASLVVIKSRLDDLAGWAR